MKSLLFLGLILFSVSAFADFEYSCNMYPGEQGGNTLLVRINGNKAKVFTINYSEQEVGPPGLVTTLRMVSLKKSLIKHYVESKDGNGIEFFIRRGAGSLGRVDHRTGKFRIYGCTYQRVHRHL